MNGIVTLCAAGQSFAFLDESRKLRFLLCDALGRQTFIGRSGIGSSLFDKLAKVIADDAYPLVDLDKIR